MRLKKARVRTRRLWMGKGTSTPFKAEQCPACATGFRTLGERLATCRASPVHSCGKCLADGTSDIEVTRVWVSYNEFAISVHRASAGIRDMGARDLS